MSNQANTQTNASVNLVDLTQRPPRSARVRLGGYVILPRMLDKGRATLVGKNGEYHFNCPLDQRFTGFVGIDAEALKAELAKGKGDGEILEWINTNAKHKREEWEIVTWSAYAEKRSPADFESLEFFTGLVGGLSKTREDLGSWFDVLDLDDYVSYGGKA